MKTISLGIAGALTYLLLASAGTAAAMPTEGIVNTECSTHSKNTIEKTIKIAVTGRDVAPSRMEFAECSAVVKVANRLLSGRVENPKSIGRFSCSPTVVSRDPDVAKYGCNFRNIYTNTKIHLSFQATYKQD